MRKSFGDKRKFIYLCGVNENKIMDKEFEKLELHIVRLELDVILEIRKEIEKLKEQK